MQVYRKIPTFNLYGKNDNKITKKIVDHAKDINEFQDKLFNYIEINQVPPAVAVGGLIACAVSIINAEQKEDPEAAKMMLRITKRMFKLSEVEL